MVGDPDKEPLAADTALPRVFTWKPWTQSIGWVMGDGLISGVQQETLDTVDRCSLRSPLSPRRPLPIKRGVRRNAQYLKK